MKNKEIRIALIENDMNMTNLARLLNYDRAYLSRLLAADLTEKKKNKIMGVIKNAKN